MDWMGGMVERRSRECTTDVRPEIRGRSFRNRIMASCLNARQIVCQVTAALTFFFFLSVNQAVRECETRTTKSPFGVYWDNDLVAVTVTEARDLTGRRNIKQEVVWNLVRTLNCSYATSLTHEDPALL